MKLFDFIKRFRNDEDGAVTVDWVVLTAALVGLGIAVLAAVETGLSDLSNDIESELTKDIVNTNRSF
jgi:Flp pilus assembly pilin Flp